MNFLLKRLREPSSWAGFAAILGTAAQAVTTKDPAAIGAVAAGIAAIFAPERAQPSTPNT